MESAAAAGAQIGHDIPSLDGLRAVAIAVVVLAHTKILLPAELANSGIFRYVVGGGLHGVQIFFVISGYLITTLLLRESERAGNVSLRAFYARRTLRIFPPFYLYLAAVGVLWLRGTGQDISTFLAAATYTLIYHPHPQGWMLQHAWSLSIEEQFYLLWPGLLVIALRRRCALCLPIIVLAVMPIARTILLLAVGRQAADHSRLVVNTSGIDMLMGGCLLAFVTTDRQWPQWKRWIERGITPWSVTILGAVGFVLVPYLETKMPQMSFAAPLIAEGYSVTAFSIAAALEYLVRTPDSIAGRILNLSVMRHIGAISYSVYLWQQLFTANPLRFGLWTYALILLAAELSFWIVERPLMRLRSQFKPVGYVVANAELTSAAARVSVSELSPNASIH